MKNNLGFTVVEIAVVLTIMAILLTMASMSLSSSEKGSRDNERRADLSMMAQCLESNFNNTQEYFGTIADMEKCPKSAEFMTPPKASAPATVLATNNTTTVSGVRPLPTKDTYVFQPLSANNSPNSFLLCTAPATMPCVNYNLYYFSELENVVKKVPRTR